MTEEPLKNVSHRQRYILKIKDPCPQCGSNEAVVDRETGEIICKKCGLVLSQNADPLG
jgi:ribosomal protein S27E